MGILEILTTAEKKQLIKIDNRLMARLFSSYKCDDGITCEIDFIWLERVFVRAQELTHQPRSRMVVFDNCNIFVDGKRVEGLTTFQTTVVIYIHTAGRVSADTLLDDVWKNPDGSKKTVSNRISDINDVFRKSQLPCLIDGSSGQYEIIFECPVTIP